MSARDPHSILYKASNSGRPAQSVAKVERLRAGKVPQWAASSHLSSGTGGGPAASQTSQLASFGTSCKATSEAATTGIRFTGMTADSSGMIVDTSYGRKTTDAVLQE